MSDLLRTGPIAVCCLLFCVDAYAVHASGARTETVAFSIDGLVLIRHVAVQHGVLRYEVLRLPAGEAIEIHIMSPADDPEVVERRLRSKHDLNALGFPGPVAPDRGAVVLVIPGSRRPTGAFEYTVQLTDGEGARAVALVPVQHGCVLPGEGTQSRIRARWAPDGRTLVLVGSVVVERECDRPREEPVLVVVHAAGRASAEMLRALSDTVTDELRRLASAGDPETMALTLQLLTLSPNDPGLLVLLARLRADGGFDGAAMATLWSLARVPGDLAHHALRRAMFAPWSSTLRRRASYHALRWEIGPPPVPVVPREPAIETERQRTLLEAD